jgi:hypothetical protein
MQQLRNGMFSILLLSITGILCAQDTSYSHLPPEKKVYALPPFSIKRVYHVDLGKGNQFQLEIGDTADLGRLQNVDSILLVFLSDLKAFRDTLADPLTVKRIDYLVETNGRKKLRIHQFRPEGSSFLLDGGEPARLRLQQDTIYILMLSSQKGITRYNRFGFFLNRYEELESLVTTGLDEKVRLIKEKGNWNYKHGRLTRDADPAITLDPYNKDYLQLDAFVNVQNYKNYFTPSVGLGATIHLQRGFNQHDFGAYWEPTFFFSTNGQGKGQIYRNDFLVVRYAYDRSDHKYDPSGAIGLYTNISIGYLIHHEGDYFPQHSFRLTAGDLTFQHGKLRLEPIIYFNDFFRGVTPGLRLSFRAL